MKRLVYILLFLSTSAYCQIVPEPFWPRSLQNEFSKINIQKIDTILVYYKLLGPWNNLSDSCKGISSIYVLSLRNKKCVIDEINCESTAKLPSINISPIPIKYFISHQKDFDRYKEFLIHQDYFEVISDQSIEFLILITSKKKVKISLYSEDRNINKLKKNRWGNTTIKAFDTTKYYINKMNGR